MRADYLKEMKNATVLIVDDDINLLNSFEDVLSLYFKKVFKAINGEEALEIFKQENIHLIISDVKMPDSDGLNLTVKIRE